jgi:hypothetical protein
LYIFTGRRAGRIEPDCTIAVACDNSNLIGIVDGQVGIYEDEDICDSFRERQSWRKESPGMRIGVDDDDKKRGRNT